MRHTLGLQNRAAKRFNGLSSLAQRNDDGASLQLTASMRPPSHHPHPLVPNVGARVGATNAIIVNMS
jgi:hypothetical protein